MADWLMICPWITSRVDPRDPILHSERVQGFAVDPDYWKGEVFAYVGLPQNLKDLKGGWWPALRRLLTADY